MIAFPCHCGRRFEEPDEAAGLDTQCPRCGRLLTVPDAAEAADLDESGGFKLADEDGEDDEVIPYARPARQGVAPGTDPETGRRAEAFDLGGEGPVINAVTPIDEPPAVRPAAPARPSPAGRGLTYASGSTERVLSLGSLWVEMFQPGNAAVLVMVFAGHVALPVMLGLPIFFAVMWVPLWGMLLVALAAHYGAVVEDTGYDGRDDLPPPLRGLALFDDLIEPAVKVLFAYGLFALPAGLALRHLGPPAGPVVACALLAVGAVFAPAVLMTLACGGGVGNLTPAGVLRVAAKSGLGYLWAVLVSLIGLTLLPGGSLVLWSAVAQATESPLQLLPDLPHARRFALAALGVIFLGSYLTHVAAWSLGLLYRRHHAAFGWRYQHHERRPRDPSGRPRPAVDSAKRDEQRLRQIRLGDRVRAAQAERRDAGLPTGE